MIRIARRIVVLAALAHAPLAAAERPWEAGVSEATRAKAQRLFEEGNVLFAREAHAPALEKYEAAIALWDHPLIRLNKAITELRLERVLEAADDLDAALRYGAAPFEPSEFAKALEHKDQIARRVARIKASCTQAGAQVLLDGEPWLSCPARGERRVLPGKHILLGEADGYLPISRRLTVAVRETAVEVMTFVPLDQAITYEYPTPRWIPWSVAGAGVAIGLGGVAFAVSAGRQMERFDQAFASRCRTSCAADLSDVPALRRSKDEAEANSAVGVTMLIAGGVTLVTGVVWATLINRPRRVVPALEVQPTDGGAEARVSWQF